ncbi:hypothetical protein CAL7716_027840 [Calothrix sp. PCC 7716]|nr:hypothetical protein CAL7716_027840 [Calothrix sp. PCC 7716]
MSLGFYPATINTVELGEADRRGIQTLARAGYDQRAMIAFLQKLRNQPTPPTFLSTHPTPDDRISALLRTISRSNTR